MSKFIFYIDSNNIVVFLSKIYLILPLVHEPYVMLSYVLQND